MAPKSIADIFEDIGMLLEIKGENPFKSRAYFNAAKVLGTLDSVETLAREKRLRQVKGIGEALAAKIEEYLATGKVTYFDELTKDVPAGLLELLQVPNLGPKKIKTLYETLGIATLGELEYACRENRLVTLPGFGPASQAKILQGIEFVKRHKGEFLLGDVYDEAERLRQRLAEVAGQGLAEVCGSIRRRKEVVRDIDVLAAGDDVRRLTDTFVGHPDIEEVLLSGDTKTSCRLRSGIEADLRVVTQAEFPYALLYFTGSKEHNVRLRAIAKARGWKLNEYGLFDGDRLLAAAGEEEIYRLFGLRFIPPELREDLGEIEAALQGELPRLVELHDLKGTFHVHTDASDGAEPLEAMVAAARAMGLSYLGVSDHSVSAFYANGLKREDILRQWERIDGLNEAMADFHVFKGIESDIRTDGSLDYEEDILEGFDFVIASVHSQFGMKRADMERRLITAMENPYTTMLGHPTGRLLLSREGYDVDMATIVNEAARTGTVIELNASPYRLDIDWRHLRHAREQGVLISINPDAHNRAGLKEIFFGVGTARKGWLEAKDVLNTRDVNDIKDMLRRMRDEKKHRVNH